MRLVDLNFSCPVSGKKWCNPKKSLPFKSRKVLRENQESILTACAQHKIAIISEIKFQLQPFTTEATALTTFLLHYTTAEVESSSTHFEVLGLGLGLEASSPRKLACPRLEDSSIFWIVKISWSAWKIFWKTFFCGDRLKNFCEDLFFFFGDRLKNFWRPFSFLESTCACVLGLGLEHSCPWPRECLFSERLSLALASDFFLCPWPRALCPRLHLCTTAFTTISVTTFHHWSNSTYHLSLLTGFATFARTYTIIALHNTKRQNTQQFQLFASEFFESWKTQNLS